MNEYSTKCGNRLRSDTRRLIPDASILSRTSREKSFEQTFPIFHLVLPPQRKLRYVAPRDHLTSRASPSSQCCYLLLLRLIGAQRERDTRVRNFGNGVPTKVHYSHKLPQYLPRAHVHDPQSMIVRLAMNKCSCHETKSPV